MGLQKLQSAVAFIKEFAQKPGEIGAIAPSSKFLAELMVEAADIQPEHVVVELGPGTGVMTREIRRAAPNSPFMAMEPNRQMAEIIRSEFPSVAVVEERADTLVSAAKEWGHPVADRIVSGLPWALWPTCIQSPIFDAIVDTLGDKGKMVTFTYVHAQILPSAKRLKETLDGRFWGVNRTRVQWKNLPPAFVWVASHPRR